VSASILGAGAAERKSKVRWAVLGDVAVAWLLTVPAAAVLAAPLYWGIAALLGGGSGVGGMR
jgi:PiT family inorganic phosphate transporter